MCCDAGMLFSYAVVSVKFGFSLKTTIRNYSN